MNFFFPLALCLLAQPETQAGQAQLQPAQPEMHAELPEIHFFRQFLVLPKTSTWGPVGYFIWQPTPPSLVPLLGVRLDFGFPDGAGFDFLGYPLPFLQLHFGVLSNFLGIGLRGGASFIPWRGVLRPAFTAEAGHHFNGATWFLANNTGLEVRRFASSIQYTFFNSSVGVDFGPTNLTLGFRFGSSFLFFNSDGHPPQALGVGGFYIKKIKARSFVPAVKFGLSACFF